MRTMWIFVTATPCTITARRSRPHSSTRTSDTAARRQCCPRRLATAPAVVHVRIPRARGLASPELGRRRGEFACGATAIPKSVALCRSCARCDTVNPAIPINFPELSNAPKTASSGRPGAISRSIIADSARVDSSSKLAVNASGVARIACSRNARYRSASLATRRRITAPASPTALLDYPECGRSPPARNSATALATASSRY